MASNNNMIGMGLVEHVPASGPAVSFDLYGTLLDVLAPLHALQSEMSPTGTFLIERWRGLLMEYTLMAALMETRESFWTLTRRALCNAAQQIGGLETEGLEDALLDAFRAPGLYQDSLATLVKLHEMGCRMTVLSNGDVAMIGAAVRSTGIAGYFEAVVSANSLGPYKPAASAYKAIVQHFDREPGQIVHVTANPWDAAGARRAGLKAIWIRDPGTDFPYGQPIDEVGALGDVLKVVKNISGR
ncbi:MAG: haloacid dehalogenase type II [Pseudomonadota bacterium]